MESQIRNKELWPDGQLKIEWVEQNMPLLRGLKRRFAEEQPFKGLKIALSVHLEAKTHFSHLLNTRISADYEV